MPLKQLFNAVGERPTSCASCSIVPVSYTHLDVYKRQGNDRRQILQSPLHGVVHPGCRHQKQKQGQHVDAALHQQSIAAELETALFVSFAGMVLKLGIASVEMCIRDSFWNVCSTYGANNGSGW